jgi:hypothetical protein
VTRQLAPKRLMPGITPYAIPGGAGHRYPQTLDKTRGDRQHRVEGSPISDPCWPTSAWLFSTRGPQHDTGRPGTPTQYGPSWCEMRGVWCYSNGAGQKRLAVRARHGLG